MEREVIFSDDLEKIFGKRPWASRSEEIFAYETEMEERKKKLTTEKEQNDQKLAENNTSSELEQEKLADKNVPVSEKNDQSGKDNSLSQEEKKKLDLAVQKILAKRANNNEVKTDEDSETAKETNKKDKEEEA
jgi:hypothetical protein